MFRQSLRSHLLQNLPLSMVLTLVIVMGFLLALRGRRWLFAGPALALFAVPPLVELYHGVSWAFPGLRGFWGPIAHEYGRWWYWAGAGLNLALALAPGAVVARHVPPSVHRGQVTVMAVLAIPAWLAAWYAVLFFSYDGQISGGGRSLRGRLPHGCSHRDRPTMVALERADHWHVGRSDLRLAERPGTGGGGAVCVPGRGVRSAGMGHRSTGPGFGVAGAGCRLAGRFSSPACQVLVWS